MVLSFSVVSLLSMYVFTILGQDPSHLAALSLLLTQYYECVCVCVCACAYVRNLFNYTISNSTI